MSPNRALLILTSGLAVGLAAWLTSTAARAGAPLFEYSCQELWMERNGIYANKGHCFKTAKAIAVFGKACFAPYGKLSGAEYSTVMKIRYWEGVKGCS